MAGLRPAKRRKRNRWRQQVAKIWRCDVCNEIMEWAFAINCGPASDTRDSKTCESCIRKQQDSVRPEYYAHLEESLFLET